MKITSRALLALFPLLGAAASVAAADVQAEKANLERGRYMVITGGCNDCHTPGYPQNDGKIPETAWLTGNAVGFQGPWGTTYPANLRTFVQSLTEDQWVSRVQTKPFRPPMPGFNLRQATESDLRAIYQFIRSLGATGQDAPAYAPPEQAVNTPYIEFVPKNLPAATKISAATN